MGPVVGGVSVVYTTVLPLLVTTSSIQFTLKLAVSVRRLFLICNRKRKTSFLFFVYRFRFSLHDLFSLLCFHTKNRKILYFLFHTPSTPLIPLSSFLNLAQRPWGWLPLLPCNTLTGWKEPQNNPLSSPRQPDGEWRVWQSSFPSEMIEYWS